MSNQFRLPSGKYTTSQRRYLREWRALSMAVERALGVRVNGFDPDVAVSLPDLRGSAVLPLWIAKKIAELDARSA